MISPALMERLRTGTRDALFASFDDLTPPGDQGRLLESFMDLMRSKRLNAVFQPIFDFRARTYLGFEGLIRGPADSALYSPAALFDAARRLQMGLEFERVCREVVLRAFARLRLPGRLFINVSIRALADPYFLHEETGKLLGTLGLHPQQIVIELTENQHVSDFSALHDVLVAYRKFGYQIAVDDLGEGFSNLRMWSEVRPEFVKIDRHFISGIRDDALKFHLVRAMHEIGEASGAALIAEGIENEADFATVRDMGIFFGQGYFIALPDGNPAPQPQSHVLECLRPAELRSFPLAANNGQSVGQLATWIAPVTPETRNSALFDLFEQDPERLVVPIVTEDGTPLGLVNRHLLVDRFARPYRREVFGKKPCTLFMNPPLIVDENVNVQEVGQMLGRADPHHMMDGFIVTRQGRYLGLGSSQALIGLMTELQISAARYANPLTQLPGNVPINEQLDRLLAARVPFVACYFDLDHFKPYNDLYGYRRGDELIQRVGELLSEETDHRLDFVGHVGGDDFVVLIQSPDWQPRIQRVLQRFDESLGRFLEHSHVEAGGYWGEDRRGSPVFHPLPSLSSGCVDVQGGEFGSHHEVSSAMSGAKKQAKKMAGEHPASRLFIERRRPDSSAVRVQ